MDSFLNEMLGGEGNRQARQRFRALWEEYEARETPESKLVKDLDRLELALQAVEYERCELSTRSRTDSQRRVSTSCTRFSAAQFVSQDVDRRN